MLEMIDNPFLLTATLLLSLVSSMYIWRAFRQKDGMSGLLGIAISIPTFNISSGLFWAVGIAFTSLIFWARRR